MKQRICIFHGPCLDGTTAAWAVWRAFGDDDTEYLPAKYGDLPPDVVGRDVVIVDFSYPRQILLMMASKVRSIVVLDHHKTAEADLKDIGFAQFDMKRSGAGMAWDHFHGQPRPWLVEYVEDHDLWKHALTQTKEVNAFVAAHPRESFADWDRLSQMPVEQVADKGAGALVFIEHYTKQMGEQARLIRFAGYDVPVVNTPYICTSEVVGALAEKSTFAVGWFQRADGQYQYSLRSRGDFDVSEIAKKYGGGGHKNAAGFTRGVTPNDESMW